VCLYGIDEGYTPVVSRMSLQGLPSNPACKTAVVDAGGNKAAEHRRANRTNMPHQHTERYNKLQVSGLLLSQSQRASSFGAWSNYPAGSIATVAHASNPCSCSSVEPGFSSITTSSTTSGWILLWLQSNRFRECAAAECAAAALCKACRGASSACKNTLLQVLNCPFTEA